LIYLFINEDLLEIIPINPLLAKEHMNLYREGKDYLDHHLELGELFHTYGFDYHAKLLGDLYRLFPTYPTFMVLYNRKLVGMFTFSAPRYIGGAQLIYYIRKGFEVYFTVLIEIFWSKERIMEVYLNSIEMGDGIYGAHAATQYWYGKDASSLTKREAAGIAAILPNPRKFKASNSSGFINRRKDRIVRVMRHIGKIEY
jgi:hypothetical protein